MIDRARLWLSGVLAHWTLRVHPHRDEWMARWAPEGFMIVPRSWVPPDRIAADAEWVKARRST